MQGKHLFVHRESMTTLLIIGHENTHATVEHDQRLKSSSKPIEQSQRTATLGDPSSNDRI